MQASKLARPALPYCVAVALLAPVLVSVGYELFRPWQWGPVGGDFAVLEIQLRAASRFQHWLGPYSRFGWSHPGPIYYYLLAPLYWLSSGASTSLYAGAALSTLACATGAVVTFFRERRSLSDRLSFALLFGATAFDLWARKLPADPWNPVVTVVPFAAFTILCARVAATRVSLLPACVFLHAFVSQTHISYLPCATVILAAALGLCFWHQRSMPVARRTLVRSVAAAVLVGAFAWLPTVIGEVLADRSNIARIWSHFAGAKASPNPLSFALTYAAARLQAPLLTAFGASEGSQGPWALMSTSIQGILLGASLLVARARKDAFVVSLAALALVATAVCCWSCRHIGQVSPHLGYLTLWFAVVGMLGWLAIALALLPAVAHTTARWRLPRVTAALASALLVGMSCVHSDAVWARYRRMPGRSSADKQEIAAATTRVASLASRAPRPYVLGIAEGRPWDALAALVLGLEKHGLTPVLQERWRFMFGGGVEYAAPSSSAGSLLVSRGPSQLGRWLDQFGQNTGLYLDAPLDPPLAHVTVEATGAEGDPSWVIDGRASAEGTPPGSSRVLRLTGDAASVTLRLPGSRVDALDAVVDARDSYLLEASADGRSFRRVADLMPASGSGMRNRHVAWFDPGPWRALRLSPLDADGTHSLAQVKLDTTRWAVSVLGAQGSRGSPQLAADGSSPREGTAGTHGNSVQLRNASSFVTLGLPSMLDQRARVDGVKVMAEGDDEYDVSGSYEGARFSLIGVMTHQRKGGLRTRRFYFNDGRAWSAVRITPRAGKGWFSIAEVSPIVAAGQLLDFASEDGRHDVVSGWSRDPAAPEALLLGDAAEGRLHLRLLAGTDHELELIVDASRSASASASLFLNSEHIGDIVLSPSKTRYRIALPHELVRNDNEVVLQLASSGVRAAGAPASLRLRGIICTPLTLRSTPEAVPAIADQRAAD